MLEKIQRRAVKMVSGLTSKDYVARLKELDMLSLESRRVLYDQVQTFKIIRGFDAVNLSTWFTLVGHNPGRISTPATHSTLGANRLEVRPGGHSLASE